eukprot:1152288-Pelagomonas_calceolata.AAC.2
MDPHLPRPSTRSRRTESQGSMTMASVIKWAKPRPVTGTKQFCRMPSGAGDHALESIDLKVQEGEGHLCTPSWIPLHLNKCKLWC